MGAAGVLVAPVLTAGPTQRHQIYIGDWMAARDREYLDSKGIWVLVRCLTVNDMNFMT